MPLDLSIYRGVTPQIQQPDSPLDVMQKVANLRDSQALAQQRQDLVNQRLQASRNQAQIQQIMSGPEDMDTKIQKLYAVDPKTADDVQKSWDTTRKAAVDFNDTLNEHASRALALYDPKNPDSWGHTQAVASAIYQMAGKPVPQEWQGPPPDQATVDKWRQTSLSVKDQNAALKKKYEKDTFNVPGQTAPVLGAFDPETGQRLMPGPDGQMVEAVGATGAEKTPTVGSDYHQYAERWAREHGTTFENLTTKQEQQARKEYGQADDRPLRSSVTVNMPKQDASSPDVKYWADQIQKDPSFATSPLISGKENSGLRTAVAHELVARGQSLDKMTAQTRQMGETAKAILPHISTIEQEAQQLNAKGLMGPVGSRWREFVSGTLKANAIATNPADAQLIGKFQADLGLLRSAVARAHGGARGGGSPTMIEHMKTIIQGGGDFQTFQGSLGAVKEWMQTYADDAKQDTGGSKPTSGGTVQQWKRDASGKLVPQ